MDIKNGTTEDCSNVNWDVSTTDFSITEHTINESKAIVTSAPLVGGNYTTILSVTATGTKTGKKYKCTADLMLGGMFCHDYV